ncbi:MAG: DMT family transporter [Solirubrobacterales bacterium]
MSASVLIGLIFALATALASIVGFLYKHKGAVESPDVEFRRPVRTSLKLFRSKWYSLGIIIALTGWGFHVAALSLAPISLVQSVIAGGLVLLTVTADRLFGHSVTRREWIGVGLAAVGLAFLAATLDGAASEAHSSFEPRVLWGYLALCSLLAVGVAVFGYRTARAGVMLAASAGLMWAASDTAIKAVSDDLGESIVTLLVDPLILVIFFASMAGLVISARSLQIGKAVPVIAVTSVAANSFTIAAGPIVFGEPVPEDPIGLVVRIAAFAMVIFAAALTPAPVRAAQPGPA